MGKRGGGSGGGGNANNAKELKLFLKNRMWRDHWYVIVAVAAIVIACFGSAVFQFSTSKDHIYRVEVTNEQLLTRVFQSGEPWVVLCSKPDDIMPDIFSEAPKRLADKSFMGVLDCTQRLPSGKTVLSRFGIKTSISPTIFTVANGGKPQQIFLNYLQTTKAFAKRVVDQTKKATVEIMKSSQLDAKCLQKSECVLLLRGAKWKPYEKQWLDQLMHENRKLQFAWIDSSMFKLSMESALPKFKAGEHRMVLFQKKRDPDTKKAIVTAKAYRNVFELLPVRQFLEENVAAELKVVATTPTMSRRKSSQKTSTNSASVDSEGMKRESYAERRRRERRETEQDRGDDYYIPQAADEPNLDGEEESDQPSTNIADEVDEIVDLDDMDE